LLAVYALTGRQLFGDLIPPENGTEKLLVLLATLVLVGLLTSWGFAFQAMHMQGIKKAPLNEALLSFYNDNELVNIYYGMSKQFSASLVHNRAITDLKAQGIKRSFWSIVATVVFFTLFIISSAVNANLFSAKSEPTAVAFPEVSKEQVSLPENTAINPKEETKMSGNGNEGDTAPEAPEPPAETVPQTPEKPDLDILAPDFDIVTESFDPSELPKNKKQEE
jgi:hypothetical protein